MRPTDLSLRSNKEFTPDSYNPQVSCDGRTIAYTTQDMKFARTTRFKQYEDYAKRSGFRVGPGSYNINNLSIGVARIKNAQIYKVPHRKNRSTRAYTMIGNLLVPDEEYLAEKHATYATPRASSIIFQKKGTKLRLTPKSRYTKKKSYLKGATRSPYNFRPAKRIEAKTVDTIE